MVDEAQRHRQTPQTSNALDNYYGWNSSMGLDVRNPVDYAIQQAHNRPSNRQPLLNQPPMQRPPQPQQRPHPNPRMRHINPRGMNQNYGGTSTYPHELQHQSPSSPRHWRSNNPRTMGGGIGGLEEQAAIPNWYKWYDKLINRFGKERGSELWHQYASDDTGIGSTNEYQTAGLWQDWKRIFERTGNAELADYWIESQQAV